MVEYTSSSVFPRSYTPDHLRGGARDLNARSVESSPPHALTDGFLLAHPYRASAHARIFWKERMTFVLVEVPRRFLIYIFIFIHREGGGMKRGRGVSGSELA